MKFAVIGNGAIAQYVIAKIKERGHSVAAQLLRSERIAAMGSACTGGGVLISSVDDLPSDTGHVIDCAGHSGLAAHGAKILQSGYEMTTLSLGALADKMLYERLARAAADGQSRLHLASGAIGALDCLSSARTGNLHKVKYVGRKPPRGWLGSPAEDILDLPAMETAAQSHFCGNARTAAVKYPKNANVAAAVALAGIGFDDTKVELVADPSISRNIHEIYAEGDFGSFHFHISGEPLADNPRSSALAAMSAVSTAERSFSKVVI